MSGPVWALGAAPVGLPPDTRAPVGRAGRPAAAGPPSFASLNQQGLHMGSVIKKRRKRMAKKKHRKLLRKTRHQRRNKK
ncbi:hypothetical protein GCM10011314_13420 [Knoellia flava]|uniref:Ribosomal protein mS38 C-terminal domain-containing protein n=1 Tax=Knoellia flava TaxID=913969 RepID=A0A8H9KTM4_9MICO|nr:hypothetical protein GCM10011314_13420 [Knoellia flava]